MIPMTRQVLNARIRMRRIQETQRETKRTSREALRRTQEKSPSCTPSDGHWRQRRGHPSSLPRRKPARSPSRPFWSTHTRGKDHDSIPLRKGRFFWAVASLLQLGGPWYLHRLGHRNRQTRRQDVSVFKKDTKRQQGNETIAHHRIRSQQHHYH